MGVAKSSADDYETVVASSVETFSGGASCPRHGGGEYVRRIADELRSKGSTGRAGVMGDGEDPRRGRGRGPDDRHRRLRRRAVSPALRAHHGVGEARHRMYEQWHPLGPVGIISAFNFPVAVWSWNSFIAAVCGDTCIWKPSSEVPLSAVAVTEISRRVMDGSGFEGVFNLVVEAARRWGRR